MFFVKYREFRKMRLENEKLKKELEVCRKELEYQKGLTWKQAAELKALLAYREEIKLFASSIVDAIKNQQQPRG